MKPARAKLIPKTNEQRRLTENIDRNDIVFCTGVSGVGKTTISVGVAVEYLLDKSVNIDKILITRPIVESGKSIGFLPGNFSEKLHPYLVPVLDELDLYLTKKKRSELQEKGKIVICPIELMRGRNFHNTVMILDEAQNAEYTQIKNFLTRIGRNSVAILNGDETQIDLPDHLAGGFIEAREKIKHVNGVSCVHLDSKNVIRSEIVSKIVDFL